MMEEPENTSQLQEDVSALNPAQKKRLVDAINVFENGDCNGALSVFLSILSEVQNSLVATCIGNCYKSMGDAAQAKNYYEKAVNLPVTSPQPYISLGNIYYLEENVHRAILMWTVANTLVADDSNLLLNLAAAYGKKDYRIQSVHYYQKYLNFSCKNESESYDTVHSKISRIRAIATASNHHGTEYFHKHKYDKALESYLTSVMNYPLQPNIDYLIGNIYFSMNDFASAIKHWTNAYVVSAFNPCYLSMMPMAYEKLNKPSYAYCYYYLLMSSHSAQKISPETIRSKLLNLGILVYQKDNNYSQFHLQEAQKLEHQNNYLLAQAEYNNALILTKLNKKSIEASLAKMRDFNNPEIRVISALQLKVSKLMREEKYDDAIKHCDKILRYSDSNNQIEAVIRRKKDECLRLSRIAKN